MKKIPTKKDLSAEIEQQMAEFQKRQESAATQATQPSPSANNDNLIYTVLKREQRSGRGLRIVAQNCFGEPVGFQVTGVGSKDNETLKAGEEFKAVNATNFHSGAYGTIPYQGGRVRIHQRLESFEIKESEPNSLQHG